MSDVAHQHEPMDETGRVEPVGHEHVHGPEAVERPVRNVEMETSTSTPVRTVSPGRGILRALLTVVGVAGIELSAFLAWVGGTDGVRLSDRAFITTTFSSTGLFVQSAGFVAIVVGLIALLGIASLGGWPIRLGGALGLAAFILVLISMARSSAFSLPKDIGPGLWVLLAGSLVCVIAGMVPATRIVERHEVAAAS
jgi:hypothetical protein